MSGPNYALMPLAFRLKLDPMLIPVDPTLADFTVYVESVLQAMLDNPSWFDPVQESLEWRDFTLNLPLKYIGQPICPTLINAMDGIVSDWVSANVPSSFAGID